MKLNFDTTEVGRSSLKMEFANDWLLLKFRVTADMDSIVMTVVDVESHGSDIATDNYTHKNLNELDFKSEKKFNEGITSILEELLNVNKDTVQLNEFKLTGLGIDLD